LFGFVWFGFYFKKNNETNFFKIKQIGSGSNQPVLVQLF
jgi:hypothetical protein